MKKDRKTKVIAEVKEVDNIESILSELSSVAIPDRDRDPAIPSPIRRRSMNPLRSKFIFRLDAPSDEDLRRQELVEKPELPRSSKEIDDRAGAYSIELPDSVEARISLVREFMLKELAPRMIAGFTGVQQARAVLQRVTGGEVDESTEHFFYQLMVKASNLRMSKFVAQYFDLPEDEIQALISQLNYTRELVLERPPLGNPMHDSEPGVEDERHTKKDESGRVKKSQAILPGHDGPGPKRRRRGSRKRADG